LTKQALGARKIALLRSDDGKIATGRCVGPIDTQHQAIKALRICDRAPALRCQGIFQQLLRRRMSHSVVRSQAETRSIQ
jgi:hypothetical protein